MLEFNVDYFENLDTPEKAYWLGYLIGDGTIFVKKYDDRIVYRLLLECQARDKEILDNFAKAINLPDKRIRYHKGHNSFIISIGAKKIVKDLVALGIPERNKSKIGKLINLRDAKMMRAQICGLFDADGHMGMNKKKTSISCGFASGNRELLEQVCPYFKGIFTEHKHKNRKGHWWSYVGSYSRINELNDLYMYLYMNKSWPHLIRKKERLELVIKNRKAITPHKAPPKPKSTQD